MRLLSGEGLYQFALYLVLNFPEHVLEVVLWLLFLVELKKIL